MVVLLNLALEQNFPGAASEPGMQPAPTKVRYLHCLDNIYHSCCHPCPPYTVACTIVQQSNDYVCVSITSFIVDIVWL